MAKKDSPSFSCYFLNHLSLIHIFCGSLTHPAPAKLSGGTPDEKAVQALKAAYEKAREHTESARAEAASVKGALSSLEQSLGDVDLTLSLIHIF